MDMSKLPSNWKCASASTSPGFGKIFMTRSKVTSVRMKSNTVDIGGKLTSNAAPTAKVPNMKTQPAVDLNSNTKMVKVTTPANAAPQLADIMYFSSEANLETWLKENQNISIPIWIKIAKVKSGIPSVTYAQALDVALCYGWIDSTRRSLDGDFFIQRFSARRAKSNWSAVNKVHIDRLTKEGRMQANGWKVIEEAKADGRWTANDKK